MKLSINHIIDENSIQQLKKLLTDRTKSWMKIYAYQGSVSNLENPIIGCYGQYFYLFYDNTLGLKFTYTWFDCGSTGDVYQIAIEKLENVVLLQKQEFYKENRFSFYNDREIETIEVYGRQSEFEISSADNRFLEKYIGEVHTQQAYLETDFQIALFDKNDTAFLIDFNHSEVLFQIKKRVEIEQELNYRFDDGASKLIRRVLFKNEDS